MSILREYRCDCGKLLFKGMLLIGAVEIKCRSCRRIRYVRSLNESLLGPSVVALVFDQRGRIVNFSDRVPAVTGYTEKELLGMNAFTLNPVITPGLYRKLWHERSGEPSSRATIFFQRKDGTYTEAASEFKFVACNDTQFLFMVIDVSGTRTYDEAPPWVGSRTGEVYFEIDADGRCRDSVMRGVEQLGYTALTLPGRTIGDLCPALKSATALSPWKERQPFEILHSTLQHADGRSIPAESYFMPSFERGAFSGYWVASWIDVERSA